MRLLPLIVLFVLSITVARAELQEGIQVQSTAAREILDAYHADSQPAERLLRFVYWTPSDREPAAGYRERLSRIMLHIQKFYADEMERNGFGRRTINLDLEDDGLLRIPLVRGAKPFSDYDRQSGRAIRDECLPVLTEQGIEANRETLLLFCNMGTWDAEKRVWTHKSPYYAGGSNKSGNAWQVDSPILDTIWLDKTEPMMKDGEYGKISMGKHNSIFIGGVAHELGHALGLPHNRARTDERDALGTALMGSGNRTYFDQVRGEGRGSFLTFAHALRLASHPQFSGSTKGMGQPGKGRFEQLQIDSTDKGFEVSGSVNSRIPVYAVIGYLDPSGGSNYDAPTTSAIPDQNGTFVLRVPASALKLGKAAELRIVGLMANGSTFQRSFAYSVGKQGKPDVSGIGLGLKLTPLAEAKLAKDKAGFDRIRASFENGTAASRIAGRLSRKPGGARPLPVPADVDQKTALVAIGDTTAEKVEVGWGRPAYDSAPDSRLLLSCGGKLFEHGIYAHAPATHRYKLAGAWKKFRGSAGIVDGHRGEVAFRILGDGKELWSSGPTKPAVVRNFQVNVQGVDSLELQVDNLGDSGGDWGFWLEPELSR